jgi:glycosyltransferase involved in cell wall biosynthesis
MPRRLTILSDLRSAQWNRDRGIAAYAQSLVLQMSRDQPEHRHLFLWDDRLPPPLRFEELAEHGEWWLESALADGFDGRIDSVLTTCFFLPQFGRGRDYTFPHWLKAHQPHRLGIVYDLIPYLFPERYLPSPESRRPYLDGLRLMREYDQLFAISQATRHDTIRWAGVDPARVHCVYGDIDHGKRELIEAGGDAGAAARHGLRQPFCLYIGGEDWRKNMEGMVRAFAHYQPHHADHQLAIVCTLTTERIAELLGLARSLGIPPGAVVCTGYVADDELIGILRQAEMMVFPSLYEGLGLPVLEAHGCGVPVVGSNTSSVAELVIPELSCNPEQPESIAAAMVRLQQTPALRERSVACGQKLLGMLGWKPAAAAVMNTLTDRPHPKPAVTRPILAVVTATPPGSTDSCGSLCAGLESKAWQTDFFTAASGPGIARSQSLLTGNSLLPVEVLRKAIDVGRYSKVLFVLANSAASLPVLKALMQTRLGCRPRRIAYLHDEDLTALFEEFLGTSLTTDAGYGLRFLVETGALDGVVVGSAAHCEALRATLGSSAERLSIEIAALEAVGNTLCELPRKRGAVTAPVQLGA